MTYQTLSDGVLRDCTPEEVVEIEARNAVPPSREFLKAQRQAHVDNLTVEVNGKVFDGDESSQDRMTRALKAADILNQDSCTWVLHDNTPAVVTKAELGEALAKAILAQAAVWVIQT